MKNVKTRAEFIAENQAEIDRILDKILDKGKDSLSDHDRQNLDSASTGKETVTGHDAIRSWLNENYAGLDKQEYKRMSFGKKLVGFYYGRDGEFIFDLVVVKFSDSSGTEWCNILNIPDTMWKEAHENFGELDDTDLEQAIGSWFAETYSHAIMKVEVYYTNQF